MTIGPRVKFFSVLALIHGVIALMGAADIRVQNRGTLGELVTWYGALTGAERGFGFFAPQVNTLGRIVFEVTERSGEKRSVLMTDGLSNEAALRVNNLISRFWHVLDGNNEDLRHSMAASFAARAFGQNPSASEVNISFEILMLNTMADAREGRQSEWKRLYQAKFLRN